MVYYEPITISFVLCFSALFFTLRNNAVFQWKKLKLTLKFLLQWRALHGHTPFHYYNSYHKFSSKKNVCFSVFYQPLNF